MEDLTANKFVTSCMENATLNQVERLIYETLFVYQCIEDDLRKYLELSYKLINLKVKPELKFNQEISNNKPLGHYINSFKVVCNNEDLCKMISRLAKDRNSFAHGYILNITIKAHDNPDKDFSEEIKKVQTIYENAMKAVYELQSETRKLGSAFDAYLNGITELTKPNN